MSKLSNQIKATMKKENEEEKRKMVENVRRSHDVARNNFGKYWDSRVKNSQDNYLSKLGMENRKIDESQYQIKKMEQLETVLLDRIKNTQSVQHNVFNSLALAMDMQAVPIAKRIEKSVEDK